MKLITTIILAICFLTISCDSDNPTTDTPQEIGEALQDMIPPKGDVTDPNVPIIAPPTNDDLKVDKVEQAKNLMQQIDKEVGNYEETTSEKYVKQHYACDIKSYQQKDYQKKIVTCFDGGMEYHTAIIYYQAAQPQVVIITLEEYNASPANKEEFEESKTNVTIREIYLEEGDWDNILQVRDENDKVAILTPKVKYHWDITKIALQ